MRGRGPLRRPASAGIRIRCEAHRQIRLQEPIRGRDDLPDTQPASRDSAHMLDDISPVETGRVSTQPRLRVDQSGRDLLPARRLQRRIPPAHGALQVRPQRNPDLVCFCLPASLQQARSQRMILALPSGQGSFVVDLYVAAPPSHRPRLWPPTPARSGRCASRTPVTGHGRSRPSPGCSYGRDPRPRPGAATRSAAARSIYGARGAGSSNNGPPSKATNRPSPPRDTRLGTRQ